MTPDYVGESLAYVQGATLKATEIISTYMVYELPGASDASRFNA
jgi:hypothetical protein